MTIRSLPMESKNLSKNYEAYRMIKDLILNHQLFPGQKLIYRDLEEKIGMSTTPIISALIMLEKEGIVVSKRNRGFYVCNVDYDDAEKILDLKEKLEQIGIEYAIANYCDDDLKVLKEKLNAYNRYNSPVYDDRRLSLDTDFHLQIASMSKNRFFLSIMSQLYESVYFRLKVIYLSPYVQKFKKDHNMLFEAIKQRELEEAKRIVKSHTRVGGDSLTQGVKS